jgi:HK97 family phage major capsid protein
MTLQELREKRESLAGDLKAQQKTVFADGYDATDEELNSIEAAAEEIEKLDKRIGAMERCEAVGDAPAPARKTEPQTPANDKAADIQAGVEGARNDVADKDCGFENYGEFAVAVKNASLGRSHLDQRLLAAAPTTYGSEGVGADGGFAVPPTFSATIMDLAISEDSLVPYTDNTPVQGNSMTFPTDETTPWGTDGVRAYWQAEAATGTQVKPVLGQRTLKLNKLLALVPMTEELLEDTSALASHIQMKTAESIRWKTNTAIVDGTGQGQPLGFRTATDSSGNAITVEAAKKTGQSADTIVAENIAQMWSQRITGPVSRVVWLAHPSAFTQLSTLSVGNQPVWKDDFQTSPNGTLFGRPIILTELCQPLGDDGDIILFDGRGYKTITKQGGIQTATSMHLYFDADAMAFRATYRIDGQPTISKRVTPANGTEYKSYFVETADRA